MNKIIIKEISETLNNIDKIMSISRYNLEEEKYNKRNSIKIVLNAIEVLKKCDLGVNIEIDDEYISKFDMDPDGIFILINNNGILLRVQKAEDILFAGSSIAKDFILEVLKDDIKFQRKLKIQKIKKL